MVIESASPKNDSVDLLRLRDSIYATNLLIVATGYLNFFNWLSNNPSSSIDIICKELGICSRPADVMLTLFNAMELIRFEANGFEVTEFCRNYLLDSSPYNLGPYFNSLKSGPVCKTILEVLKSDKPANWSASGEGKEWSNNMELEDFADFFTAAMDSRGLYLAPEMAKAINTEEYRNLIDVAGGSGCYGCEIAKLNRNLDVYVLEKSPITDVAKHYIRKHDLSERVKVITGDMFDEIPNGYDMHLFSHALHDWGIDDVTILIEKSYDALAQNGKIIIYDAHIKHDKSGPLPVAEYSVLLMLFTEGKCYSFSELEDTLIRTGFTGIEITPTNGHRSIISARKK